MSRAKSSRKHDSKSFKLPPIVKELSLKDVISVGRERSPKGILRKTEQVFRHVDTLVSADYCRQRRAQQALSTTVLEDINANVEEPPVAAPVACGAKFPGQEDAPLEQDLNNNNELKIVEYQTIIETASVKTNESTASTIAELVTEDEKAKVSKTPQEVASEADAKGAQPEKKLKLKKGFALLSDQLCRKIFSYFNPIELHTCAQVSRHWKELYDTLTNPPKTFNGRTKLNVSHSRHACRLFLSENLMSSETKRCYKLHFYNVLNWQMLVIAGERAQEFSTSVSHMSTLHLVNCNLRWDVLITIIKALPNLHTLVDKCCTHFHLASCGCGPHTRQGPLDKVYERLQLGDLKRYRTRGRVFKLYRKSLRKEICPYLQIVARLMPFLEEVELIIGPWRTPKGELRRARKVMEQFTKALQDSLIRVRRSLKTFRVSWNDSRFFCLFDKIMEAIYQIDFSKLRDLSLEVNGESMRNPEKLPHFVRFLNAYDTKNGGKLQILKTYISPVFLTKEWIDLLKALQERIRRRSSCVFLRLGVVVSDSATKFSERCTTSGAFQNGIFLRGLRDLQINILNEQTQTLREVMPTLRLPLPNVEKLSIKIGERCSGKSFAFRDYSFLSLAFNFKFLTELRISDQPPRKWDILDYVIGKSDRASLTYAYISSRDMVLLCELLTRLKVLQLHANLNDLRDTNFTGIRSKYYVRNPGNGQMYLKKRDDIFKFRREPSIYNLKRLQILSLRGLGRDVTDITCRYAFEGMSHLKYVELSGDTSITQNGRLRLNARLRPNDCQVNFCGR